MADNMRKGVGDKAQEKMTPDSSKSTTDKVKESVTGAGDKVARDAQPDDSKSTGQSITDKMSREKDTSGSGGSVLDKTKNALGMDKK